jgi:LmbE family N-acetylglucosaminyl deacetylase
VSSPGLEPYPADTPHPARTPHPIDAPGTDEATWAVWETLDSLPGASVNGVSVADVTSAVIVAAHPDDEVLGAGGLISALAASGARLRLIAITDGEGSHRGLADPVALARRRAAESVDALRALGANETEVIRLGLPDSGLAGHEEKLTATLTRLVAGFDVCLAPWDHDLHPDHETAGRAARRASGAPVLSFPIWMWHWAFPADPRVPWEQAVRVPLAPGPAARKRAAIGRFASQTEDRGGGLGPVLSPGMITHFTRAMEVLLR